MNADEPHDVLTLGEDRPSTRGRILLAVVLAVVLGVSGYRLLGDGGAADAEAETESGPDQLPLAGAGPSLPQRSGQRSPVVYAVGRTVHGSSGDVRVHGPGVGAGAVVRVRGPAISGWLVSVERPNGRARHGLVDATGAFHPWGITGFSGQGLAIMSPDGSQVLGVVGGRTRVLDVASGEPTDTVPRGRAVGWNDSGIHLLRGRDGSARVWAPGTGTARETFDARTCDGDLTAVATAVRAGWASCRRPGLVAVSPSGARVLAVRTPHGLEVTTQSGKRLPASIEDDARRLQRVDGAAFRGEDQVVLSLTERTSRGAVSGFVSCSVSAGTCERVTDPLPARRGPGAAFLVAPPCEHEGRGGGF